MDRPVQDELPVDRQVQSLYDQAVTGEGAAPRSPATVRGRATRQRIVAAAAELMHQQGVAGTSLDEVRKATGTSKSQLYHYFGDKAALVRAVIAFQLERIITAQQPHIARLDSVEALRAWSQSIVDLNRKVASTGGCPLGRLASELSDSDPEARAALASAFRLWQQHLSSGLAAMNLPAHTDADAIAGGLLAALQGGLLLAQTHRSSKPLETALDQAIGSIEQLAAPTRPPSRSFRSAPRAGRLKSTLEY